MNIKDLKDLAKCAVLGKIPTDFTEGTATAEDVKAALRENIKAIAGNYDLYRRNKLDVFELMQETLDIIVPKNIIATIGQFAEFQNVGHNEKVVFKIKVGKNRAKRFVTKAAVSGVYESFRLDSKDITTEMFAIGGSGMIDFERFLAGDEDLSEYAAILQEGIVEAIFHEIQEALRATLSSSARPTNTRASDSAFNAANFAAVINTVKAYGDNAVIFASPEFISAMGPDNIVAGVNDSSSGYGFQPIVPVADINEIRETGYIGTFRGCKVIKLPQSFTDETNAHQQVDPQTAYIFPTGGEKVVRVAVTPTVVKDWENRDNSMEIQAYKKLGIVITSLNNWGVYRNTGITSTYEGATITL